MRNFKRQERGFTLIEIIVAIAILGVLAAVAIPSVLTFLSSGERSALLTDEKQLQQVSDAFKTDKHKGPDVTFNWGLTGSKRLFATEDGEVGDVELSPSLKDADFTDRDNFQVMKHLTGPPVGTDAVDSDIKEAALWIGLLVNEPSANDGGGEQNESGDAHPQSGETGEYLLEFPESAAEINTDTDDDPTNDNGRTEGTYSWIVLHNGQIKPAYKSVTDSKWYVGYNDAFP